MQCPHCATEISDKAIICWVCDCVIDRGGFRECSECASWIRISSSSCRFCKANSDRPSQFLAEKIAGHFKDETHGKLFLQLSKESVCASLAPETVSKLLKSLFAATIGNVRGKFRRPIALAASQAVVTTTMKELIRLVRLSNFNAESIRQVEFICALLGPENKTFNLEPLMELVRGLLYSRSELLGLGALAVADVLRMSRGYQNRIGFSDTYFRHVEQMSKTFVPENDQEAEMFRRHIRRVLDARFELGQPEKSLALSDAYLQLLNKAKSPFFGQPYGNPEKNWLNEFCGAWFFRAEAEKALGAYSSALDAYKQSVVFLHQVSGPKHPAGSTMLLAVGACYEALNDMDQAERCYKEVLDFAFEKERDISVERLTRIYLNSHRGNDLRLLLEEAAAKDNLEASRRPRKSTHQGKSEIVITQCGPSKIGLPRSYWQSMESKLVLAHEKILRTESPGDLRRIPRNAKFRFQVCADGKVQNLSLQVTSGVAAWDQTWLKCVGEFCFSRFYPLANPVAGPTDDSDCERIGWQSDKAVDVTLTVRYRN